MNKMASNKAPHTDVLLFGSHAGECDGYTAHVVDMGGFRKGNTLL